MSSKYPQHMSFWASKFTAEQLRLVAAQEGKEQSDILRAALDQYLEGKLAAVPTRRTITDGVKFRLDELERHLIERINDLDKNETEKLRIVLRRLLTEMQAVAVTNKRNGDNIVQINDYLLKLYEYWAAQEASRGR